MLIWRVTKFHDLAFYIWFASLGVLFGPIPARRACSDFVVYLTPDDKVPSNLSGETDTRCLQEVFKI